MAQVSLPGHGLMCLVWREIGSVKRGVGAGSHSVGVKGLPTRQSESRSDSGPGGYLCFQAMMARGRQVSNLSCRDISQGPRFSTRL